MNTRFSVFSVSLLIIILVTLVFMSDCKGQVLVDTSYTLLEITFNDLNGDKKADVLLLVYDKDGNKEADRVLVYLVNGKYIGYMELIKDKWYAFYPDGSKKYIGKKSENPYRSS